MAGDGLTGKKAPYNLEAEQSCLGSIIIDNTYINDAMEKLQPDDFYYDNNKIVYSVIVDLFDKNQPIDLVMLTNTLKDKNLLEKIGGAEYLNTLADIVPSAANFNYYAQIVIEKSLLRKLIAAANQILTYAYEEDMSVNEIVDQAEKIIFDVAQRRITQDFQKIGNLILNTIQYIEKLYDRKDFVTGVPSGIISLDEVTSGFQGSDLIILAARPSKGKTSLAINIAEFNAIKRKNPVGIFSCEMAAEQILMRLLGSQAKVDIRSLRTGFLTSADWTSLMEAAPLLHDAPLFIDDTPNIGLMQLRAKARRAVVKYNLKLIIIDYLQLISLNIKKENKQQEISEISRSLKALARELKIPIIALSQLRRMPREDEKPQLSDLRESGAIEQDADVVIFIHSERDEQSEKEEDSNLAVKVDLMVAKQRNGPTKNVEALFLKKFTRFENLEKHEEF